MNSSWGMALVCVMCAGSVCSFAIGEEEPVRLSPSEVQSRKVAHIYYNLSSGDRVITLFDDGQVQGGDNGVSGPIWSSLVGAQCASAGIDTAYSFSLGGDSFCSSIMCSAVVTLVDWGEMPLDTVVDCVQVNWVTDHDDVDLNSDGIGDGVEGLGGQWTYYDADNGRAENACTRLSVVSFLLTDLPGDISGVDQWDPDNTYASYSADIDLGSAFSESSLVFEFGDSDGDLQGAAFGNNDVDTNFDGIGDGVSIANADLNLDGLPDGDLDGDGLFDWSWAVKFFLPGTADLDGDGELDGDLLTGFRYIGVDIASPEGEAIDNGDGSWTWALDPSILDAGYNVEDAFALNWNGVHVGVFWFGGFSCSEGDFGALWEPSANFAHRLYGPSSIEFVGCNAADLAEPYGVLNFFDVSTFLSEFTSQDDSADLAAPFGVWNFFDVSAFLSLFAAGCP